ncbi:MAG: hypothetical protein EZS28_039779 [Streblomastix strix]|uniref:Uncharacterized protein n=1 Tax=Streblomastix strix TaxID=222440 RepID=A0A5J4U2V4_9EUKA|nr:MAG: hypothetical protein EZS28_039779 [Streblomastix strix]
MMFAMPQYPTWFFPVLFHNIDLVIDQRHVIPAPYEALTQAVNGQIGIRAYPDPVEVGLTQTINYLCDANVQIMFDDNSDPQVLSLGVIGEMGDPNTVWQQGHTLFSIVNNDTKPKFTRTPHNIPLNAVMFAQKVLGYPICWNGAIPIDCYINPNGNVIINTMCQLYLLDDFAIQVCDSYAVYNQST